MLPKHNMWEELSILDCQKENQSDRESVRLKFPASAGITDITLDISPNYEQSYVVFTQNFERREEGTNLDDDPNHPFVSQIWPSFLVPDNSNSKNQMKFTQLCGNNAGWEDLRTGFDFNYNNRNKICQGPEAGPIFITGDASDDENIVQDQIFIISSYDSHMAHNIEIEEKNGKAQLNMGVMATAQFIPENFDLSTIVYVGRQPNDQFSTAPAGKAETIRQGIINWGKALTSKPGTVSKEISKLNDPIASHISYSTERGAYYYYNTEDEGENSTHSL